MLVFLFLNSTKITALHGHDALYDPGAHNCHIIVKTHSRWSLNIRNIIFRNNTLTIEGPLESYFLPIYLRFFSLFVEQWDESLSFCLTGQSKKKRLSLKVERLRNTDRKGKFHSST